MVEGWKITGQLVEQPAFLNLERLGCTRDARIKYQNGSHVWHRYELATQTVG